MFNFLKKDKTLSKEIEETQCNNKQYSVDDSSDGYIWVEGFKGTKSDMSCSVNLYPTFGGLFDTDSIKTEQYELNERKILHGSPELYENGFHFCTRYEDVFEYYEYNFENRYFKVKALVRKKDFETLDPNDSKMAAKEIILYEEIFPQYEDVEKYMTRESNKNVKPYKITKNDFIQIQKVGYSNYFRDKFISMMINANYSEAFSNLIIERFLSDIAYTKHIVDVAIALEVEHVTKDMACYILLCNSFFDYAKEIKS